MPTLQETLELVKTAHGAHNAVDKSGVPYYWHLVRVMLRLQTDDLELLQIALLHDVVEDTHITLEYLQNLGYSDRVVEAVRWSSKNMFEMSFAEWMRAIGKHAPDDTVLLKISDCSDNWGFERMQGLMAKNPNHLIKPKKTLDLRQKIDRKVEKKMRFHGDMGVYDRYYKGWNFMFENQERMHLINHVFIEDFCFLHQFKSLTHYLPEEEMKNYLKMNKINTWKLLTTLNIIQDKSGQDYVALIINPEDTLTYTNFLSEKIDVDFINNQQQRDHNKHHVTIINVMQYNKLKKEQPEVLEEFLNRYVGEEFEIFTYGIGQANDNKKDSTAWFIVCENNELKEARSNILLPNQDLHITLAFDKADVFTKPKNKTSIVYSNDILWENFSSQFYPKSKKYRP